MEREKTKCIAMVDTSVMAAAGLKRMQVKTMMITE